MACGWRMATAGALVRAAGTFVTLAPPARRMIIMRHSFFCRHNERAFTATINVGNPRGGCARAVLDSPAGGCGLADDRLPHLTAPSQGYMRHAYSPLSGPIWKAVSSFLGWGEQEARELVKFGGVYYKPGDAPATAKPKRELHPERAVETGEYLRILPDPRRYPSFVGVDWESRIVYETPRVMLVNKPAGVPAHATLDNFRENMLAGIRDVRPELEPYLPHRLDIDTSGLVIIAKDRETLRAINDLIKGPGLALQTGDESPRARKAKNKALRRSVYLSRSNGLVAVDTSETTTTPDLVAEETVAPGSIRKRYRALVEVLPGCSPLQVSVDPLTHYQKVSPRAPKEFHRSRPEVTAADTDRMAHESWVECRLQVLSTRDTAPPEPEAAVARRFQEVEVELLTGRTHQIRGQLAAEGCPIYGDILYGPDVLAERPSTVTAEKIPQIPTNQRPPSSLPTGRRPQPYNAVSGSSKIVLGPLDSVKEDGRERGRSSLFSDLGDEDPSCTDGSDVREAFLSPGLGEGSSGDGRRFVESPKMALQACDILLELEGDAHACSLPRDTCWWVSA